MHALAFKFKRLHLGLLALQRHLLLQFDITPARVELLIIMARLGNGPEKAMRQSDIWRALGVRRSVTCRMLAALEEEGFIWRTRHCADMRQKSVHITPKARWVLFHVERLAARLKVALLVAFAPWKGLLSKFNGGLDMLRRDFDRSQFDYPWILQTSRWLPKIPPRISRTD